MTTKNGSEKISSLVSRISVSLPADLLTELDRMVESRGYDSRSRAIGEMVNYQLAEHKRSLGNEVMAGTLTLLYNRATRGLQGRLADIQYHHVAEVISSLHVHLTEDQMLEVILVQGPAAKLQAITHEMLAQRGVITGRLQLLAAVKRQDKPVSEVCHAFEPLPQILKNVRYANGKPLEKKPVVSAIAAARQMLGESGRLVIRPSGTEPVIRVMAEGDDAALVLRAVDDIVEAVTKAAA
ncbi:MAG: nickel-responsive transcriptional regulator NikR [Bosea sp. 12-68-7]|nr:MAG: nickel-responsive transcriptional regulator NikR [Bosea sp. 12-68-7]